jgi:translocation and assembly module TamA
VATDSDLFRACAAAAVTLAALLAAPRCDAADPQPYSVSLPHTGDDALDAALAASSQLESLRKATPVSPAALIGRAQADVGRLQTVLGSFGYYQGKVGITVQGRPLDDPTLGEALADLPSGTSASTSIGVLLGPLYRLRAINIEGTLPDSARSALELSPGAPAIAANVLAAGVRLRTRLRDDGYALAVLSAPVAYEIPEARVLDVTFKVDAGAQYRIGTISVLGLDRVRESYVRRHISVKSGDLYSFRRIDQARQDLLKLGVFATVTVHEATTAAADGRMPVTFEVRERRRHAVTATAAYSSDLGGSVGATWSDRNVFGSGEQLNLSATALNLGGTISTSIGYDVLAQYVKPDFLQRDQALQFSVRALHQNLEAYDQTALIGGTLLTRKLSSLWNVGAGVTWTREQIIQEMTTTYYTLLALPLSGKYDTTGVINPLLDPLHGVRATLSATPTESYGGEHSGFVVIQANASTYLDLGAFAGGKEGHTVLALRGVAGTMVGAGQFSLPPDQRFYAGGPSTVRGYAYQSVGPTFTDGSPQGGTAIQAVGAELRLRFGQTWGAAAFVDAGNVTATSKPFQGPLSVGIGAGVRYYTVVGPIRFDIAVPTDRTANPAIRAPTDRYVIYIGLGQVF